VVKVRTARSLQEQAGLKSAVGRPTTERGGRHVWMGDLAVAGPRGRRVGRGRGRAPLLRARVLGDLRKQGGAAGHFLIACVGRTWPAFSRRDHGRVPADGFRLVQRFAWSICTQRAAPGRPGWTGRRPSRGAGRRNLTRRPTAEGPPSKRPRRPSAPDLPGGEVPQAARGLGGAWTTSPVHSWPSPRAGPHQEPDAPQDVHK